MKFTSDKWKGIAYYRDKQYDKAYDEFKKDHSALGYYNQGNALAYMGKYQEAIDAYKKALKKENHYPDAKHNIDVLEKLLKNQQKPQSGSSKDNQQSKKADQKDKSANNNKSSQNPAANGSQDQQNTDNQTSNDQPSTAKSQSSKASQNQENRQNTNPNQNSKENNPTPNNQEKNGNDPSKSATGQSNQEPASQNKEEQHLKDENLQGQKAANINQNSNTPGEPQKSLKEDKNSRKTEKDQQIKAQLIQIPDDPGGLLRNKFLRDYQHQQQGENNE